MLMASKGNIFAIIIIAHFAVFARDFYIKGSSFTLIFKHFIAIYSMFDKNYVQKTPCLAKPYFPILCFLCNQPDHRNLLSKYR